MRCAVLFHMGRRSVGGRDGQGANVAAGHEAAAGVRQQRRAAVTGGLSGTRWRRREPRTKLLGMACLFSVKTLGAAGDGGLRAPAGQAPGQAHWWNTASARSWPEADRERYLHSTPPSARPPQQHRMHIDTWLAPTHGRRRGVSSRPAPQTDRQPAAWRPPIDRTTAVRSPAEEAISADFPASCGTHAAKMPRRWLYF